jgi:hypothetical protein
MKPITKPGMHGPLFRYAIEYRDAYDPCCPIFTQHTWAYNLEHAEDRFFDAPDAEGWEILSLRRLVEGPNHRTPRHAPRSRL